jgi:hypothetical protein
MLISSGKNFVVKCLFKAENARKIRIFGGKKKNLNNFCEKLYFACVFQVFNFLEKLRPTLMGKARSGPRAGRQKGSRAA